MPWDTQDIPDQSGRRAVVTGANSGIGYVTARELARAGAHVTLAVRDPARGEQAAQRIRAAAPGAQVEVDRLDLADLGSVRAFASTRTDGLDLLVNNAGIMGVPYGRTVDGFESQLGTNHLGHFALTGLLLPRLLERTGARVVTVSSLTHRMGRIAFEDLQSERGYRRWAAYGQSKLANLLFAFELQRRALEAGARLRSLAAHPGWAATHLQTRAGEQAGNRIDVAVNRLLNRLLAQTAEKGALPTLYAATADLPAGTYAGPDGPFEARGHPKRVGASAAASDEATARRLWDVSETLTGVRYEWAAVRATG